MSTPSPSVDSLWAGAARGLRKLGFTVVLLLGGLAHELRHPLVCASVASRHTPVWRKPQAA